MDYRLEIDAGTAAWCPGSLCNLIEPYRHLVKRIVFEGRGEMTEFNPQARLRVLGLIKRTVMLGNLEFHLPAAVRETIASYVRVLESGAGGPALP